MHLGGRKVVGRGFSSGYEKLLPKRISEDEMLSLVKRLRSGDQTVIEELILQHLALTIHIVSRYVHYFPAKADDMMGTASLALAEAVRNFEVKSINDNITGYVVTFIHGRIAHFIEEGDSVIKISSYGFERACRKAKKAGLSVSQCLPQAVSLVPDTQSDTGAELYATMLVSNVKNVSTVDDHTQLEIDEIVSKCYFTRQEAIVLQGSMDGKLDTEIAKDISVHKSRIGQIRTVIVEKLKPFYLENQ